jgi:hypothetical protein
MTAIVTNANAYQFAIGKQTNGTTPLGTAAYALPVFDADLHPVSDLAEIVVTDASSIQGDPYKKPTSWEADVTVPMLAASMGQFLVSMWGTDTIGTAVAGTAYTHTYTGLGGTQPFIGCFDDFTNSNSSTAGTAKMSYANGVATELTFSADQEGGPAKLQWKAVGSTPSVATYSVTTTDAVGNGYFGMQLSSAAIEIDNDTPNVNPSSAVTNVESFSITVARNVEPAPTADSITVGNLAQGKLTLAGTMSFYFSTWQEWKASYFGSVTGSSASSTITYGALDLNFKHSSQSTWGLELYAPKVAFYIPNRQPDASGGALKLPVTLGFATPASGEHLQPILTNGVSSAY